MNLLDEKGIIVQNKEEKGAFGSYARKWCLMFAKTVSFALRLRSLRAAKVNLAPLYEITPFEKVFLQADTYPAVQEFYLRAMCVEPFPASDSEQHFPPLRWLLAVMLELEKRTGSFELSKIELEL